MNSFLCAEDTSAGTIIIYVVLILVLIAMLIMPYFSQRKKNKEFAQMLETIRVGDLVKTAGGIIGKVTKITDKGDIKTVILETGSKNEKSYMEFDMTMIYCVLKSSKVEADSDKLQENETVVIGNETESAVVSEDAKTEQETGEQTSNETASSDEKVDETAKSASGETETNQNQVEKKTTKKPATKKSTKTAGKTTKKK